MSITWQLVLSIPLLFAALIANSKITDEGELNNYRYFNLFVNSASIALVSNTIGLLVTKYVSYSIGIAYFLFFLYFYFYFLYKDRHGGILNELIVIVLSLALGLIPALSAY